MYYSYKLIWNSYDETIKDDLFQILADGETLGPSSRWPDVMEGCGWGGEGGEGRVRDVCNAPNLGLT